MYAKAVAFCLSRPPSHLFPFTRLQSQEQRDGGYLCYSYVPSAQYTQQAEKRFCEIRRAAVGTSRGMGKVGIQEVM